MTPTEISDLLAQTLEDRRLSRNERQALADVFKDLDDEGRLAVSRQAFEVARAAVAAPEDLLLLDWLEGVVKVLHRDPTPDRSADLAEAYFSPGEDCPRQITRLLARARSKVDICVFTITDDRITAAILDAYRRNVAIRVITDNDKVFDEGSDIDRLHAAGIPVRVDRTEYHMHHKFAIFDDSVLLTGSYNWTRGASAYNNENFVVTGDRRLIAAFQQTFERLWKGFA